jgi:hypothetical protein
VKKRAAALNRSTAQKNVTVLQPTAACLCLRTEAIRRKINQNGGR